VLVSGTYVLFSSLKGRFYIGASNNIDKRLDQHNGGYVRSTKPYIPWELIGFIKKSSRAEAMLLGKKLKNLNTEDLKKFILKYFGKSM
jgi:putative endonuclease